MVLVACGEADGKIGPDGEMDGETLISIGTFEVLPANGDMRNL